LRYGGKVLGICGGYQMLGQTIHDPTGIEGTIGTSQGLGYLPINTTLQEEKQLTHSQGKLLLKPDGHNKHNEATISGYQIHVGDTEREKDSEAFSLLTNGQLDGCVSTDNQVAGSYLHGMFDSPEALQQIISWAGADTNIVENYYHQQEHELDRLANACMTHLDWEKIQTIITDNQKSKQNDR
jgi:adenosylcobyric acid synthase